MRLTNEVFTYHTIKTGLVALAIIVGLAPLDSYAQRRTAPTSVGRGAGQGAAPATRPQQPASASRGSEINRSNTANINQSNNTNINRNNNVNINNNTNINVDVDNGWNNNGWNHHPVAAGVVIGATAAVTSAVVGSMIYTLPPSCTTVVYAGGSYSQCGSVWYRPQYSGTSVTYIVVSPPY